MSAKIVISTENLPYEDWLEFRKSGIGGSDASVVCGINRYNGSAGDRTKRIIDETIDKAKQKLYKTFLGAAT